MRLRVVNPFRDKNNFNWLHNVGELIEVDDERGDTLISLGLAEKEKGEAEEATPDPIDTEAVEETESAEEDVNSTEEQSEEDLADVRVTRKRKKK